jgi:hypothetical protein
MPGRKFMASESHSVSHNALAPPLALAMTQSGWYFDERGNRSETNRSSEVIYSGVSSIDLVGPGRNTTDKAF